MSDLQSKTDAELQTAIEEFRRSARVCETNISTTEQTIANAKKELSQTTSKVSDMHSAVRKRNETAARIRELQRLILTSYRRFPKILDPDTAHHQVLTTAQLRAQEERLTESLKALQDDVSKKREREGELSQQRSTRVQEHQRIDSVITQNINERHLAIEQTEKALLEIKNFCQTEESFMNKSIQRASQRLGGQQFLKELEDSLNDQLESLEKSAQKEHKHLVRSLVEKEKTLVSKTRMFFDTWWNRRRVYFYNDPNSILRQTLANLESKTADYEELFRVMGDSNDVKTKEQVMTEKQIKNLEKQIKKAKENIAFIEESMAKLSKTERKLTPQQQKELTRLRTELKQNENYREGLAFELNQLKNPILQHDHKRIYDNARRSFRKTYFEYITQKVMFEKSQLEAESNTTASLSTMDDPHLSLIVVDDLHVVDAGTLESIVGFAFHPQNEDDLFIPALLIMAHSSGYDTVAILQLILKNYQTTTYEGKSRIAAKIASLWRQWFPNEFNKQGIGASLTQLVSIAGSQSILSDDLHSTANVENDTRIPYIQADFLLDISSMEVLAEHFMYLEYQLLQKVSVSEYIDCGWQKDDHLIRAPNISAYFEHFNKISRFVIISIINQRILEVRVAVIQKWILLMDAAIKVHNLPLVFEIVGAFSSPPISLLTRTWGRVDPQLIAMRDKNSSVASNGGRNKVNQAVLNTEIPSVYLPFFGKLQTDLIYCYEGNRSTKTLPESGEEAINFQKFRAIASVFRILTKNWCQDYPFLLKQEILNAIKGIPIDTRRDAEIYELAQELENLTPPLTSV